MFEVGIGVVCNSICDTSEEKTSVVCKVVAVMYTISMKKSNFHDQYNTS